MLFWLVASFVAAAAALATALPLLGRSARTISSRAEYDEEVYRAQLAELREDERRGVISSGDASVARAEIGRRLLRTREEERGIQPAFGGDRVAVWSGLAVALLLPVGSFLFYDRWGSPEVADQPLASRAAPEPQVDVAAMIAEIEKRLQAQPDDGAGWSVVAPVYLQLGEARKAVDAFRNALRLTPPTAQKVAGLGEALVQEAEGRVTPEAAAEFRRALEIDPAWAPARFFLALRLSQDGRADEAARAWSELLRTGPADGPWRPIAEAALADARDTIAEPPGPIAAGPSDADIAAAANLSEEDRREMVQGMVSQLAARLKETPQDPEGWKRLLRSYVVLGDTERARTALTEAGAVFATGSRERMDILRFAESLGLGPDASTP